MPPDGRRKKQALAGGLPSVSFVFGSLELVRPKAQEAQNDRCGPEDTPLHHGHVFHAITNSSDDFGGEVCNVPHDLGFKYDRCDLARLFRITEALRKPTFFVWPRQTRRVALLAIPRETYGFFGFFRLSRSRIGSRRSIGQKMVRSLVKYACG